MPTWRLTDADPLARDHKYTFYKPSRELIAKLKPGDRVKLIFEFDNEDPKAPRAERMWVTVMKVHDAEHFIGELSNDPAYIRDLKFKDPIEFQACHVITSPYDEDDSLVERYIKRCFVTNRVLTDGAPIGDLYREAPEEVRDSGWRILAGDESDEYMDDSKNLAYVSLGAVLSRDDSILHLLERPEGVRFVREQDGTFTQVEGPSVS